MAGKTDYLSDGVLNAILRNTSLALYSPIYVGLFTAAPNDAYTAAAPNGAEVSGNGYARTAITFGTPVALSGGGRKSSNSAIVTFPVAGPGNWETITYFGIFEQVSGGEMLYWGTLTTPVTISSGDTASFAVGSIVVSED